LPVYPIPAPENQLSNNQSLPEKPQISLVNAAAFKITCKTKRAISFQIASLSTVITSLAAQMGETTPEIPRLPKDYEEYADVFSTQKAKILPEHRPYDLAIQIKGDKIPLLGPIYFLSALELETLQEFLEENTKTSIIRPSKSPCGAPVLFIKKKDGTLRLCIDYCGLNRMTHKDQYPIPLLNDLLDAPRKAQIYSKIDLKSAYHLVCITKRDEWKTAFRTRYGSFKWLMMPFGLSNALSAFQCFMNNIFSDVLDVFVVIYLDDILIYSDNMDNHKKHVKEVLKRLRENRLYASPTKCVFHQDRIEFLGFVLGVDGLRIDESKTQTIQNWPTPRRVKDVQSFLGFANFYRHFIDNYAEITSPLTRLTQKNEPWFWTTDCQVAFDNIKEAFTIAPILGHWDPESPMILETDASDH